MPKTAQGASAAVAFYLPQWTAHVAVDGGGRDPLGLSRVGGVLLDFLSPAVVLNTDRARYYSLYCWILWHIQETEEADGYEAFARAFQRREAAVALATSLAPDGSSPIGVDQVLKWLDAAGRGGSVDTQKQVLPSSPLGGFGQYYSGVLHTMGLTHRDDEGVDRVTEGFATGLAETVQRSVEATAYVRDEHFLRSRVDIKVLKRSAEHLTIDGLPAKWASKERELLVNLLFGFDDPANRDRAGQMRRTLALILEVVAHYQVAGIAIDEDALDDGVLYWPSYYGCFYQEAGRSKPVKLSAMASEQARWWSQFALHQYLAVAIENIFAAVLDVAAMEPRGVEEGEVLRVLVGKDFTAYLRKATGRPCLAPSALLSAIGVTAVPDRESSRKARPATGATRTEHEELNLAKRTPGATLASSCLALVALYSKWRGAGGELEYATVTEKAGPELSAPSLLPLLDSWLDRELSWVEAIRVLIDMLIKQHDMVMYGKGRLESCWIRVEGGRVICEQSYKPYFRGSRQKQMVSILVDLGLLRWTNKSSEGLVLTPVGRKVLDKARAPEV
jgi:hypothetical protein